MAEQKSVEVGDSTNSSEEGDRGNPESSTGEKDMYDSGSRGGDRRGVGVDDLGLDLARTGGSSSRSNRASMALSHSAGGGGARTYAGFRFGAGRGDDAAGGVRGGSVSLLDALEVGDTGRWAAGEGTLGNGMIGRDAARGGRGGVLYLGTRLGGEWMGKLIRGSEKKRLTGRETGGRGNAFRTSSSSSSNTDRSSCLGRDPDGRGSASAVSSTSHRVSMGQLGSTIGVGRRAVGRGMLSMYDKSI